MREARTRFQHSVHSCRYIPTCYYFLDLGSTSLTSAKVASAMLLAFSSLPRLPVFTASAWDDLETTTSDHVVSRSPNAPADPTSMSPQPVGSVAQTFLDSIIPPASPTMPRVRRVTEARLCDKSFSVTGSPLRIWKYLVLSNV